MTLREATQEHRTNQHKAQVAIKIAREVIETNVESLSIVPPTEDSLALAIRIGSYIGQRLHEGNLVTFSNNAVLGVSEVIGDKRFPPAINLALNDAVEGVYGYDSDFVNDAIRTGVAV